MCHLICTCPCLILGTKFIRYPIIQDEITLFIEENEGREDEEYFRMEDRNSLVSSLDLIIIQI